MFITFIRITIVRGIRVDLLARPNLLCNNTNTNDANPDQTQIPVQQITLKLLRDNLHKTLSRRVFLTGGGYAPGANGVKPIGSAGECAAPVQINTVTGTGVLGDFKGRNRREGPVQIEFEFTN